MSLDGLTQWLKKIENSSPIEINMGLDRVKKIQERMALNFECPIIVVGGTNGKGSVCAILESILLASGFKVGLYTSPHITRFNERIKICGSEINDESLVDAFEHIDKNKNDVALTYFEWATLAAAYCFSRFQLDVIILEVGMGGRLDAVNIFDGQCSIITSLAMDHTEFLGTTLDKIAKEKAGIFRKNSPVICGEDKPPVELEREARRIGSNFNLVRRNFGYSSFGLREWVYWSDDGQKLTLPWPSLRGDFQLNNAAVSLAALNTLSNILPVDKGSIRKGLVNVSLKGRCQSIPCRPEVIIDVGHNPQAASAFGFALSQMPKVDKTVAILGMLSTKDAFGIINALKKQIDYWIITLLKTDKTMTHEQIRRVFFRCGIQDDSVEEFSSFKDAYSVAKQLASGNDRVVVFGSFFLVNEAISILKDQHNGKKTRI